MGRHNWSMKRRAVLSGLAACSASSVWGTDIPLVFAAASLKSVLDEISDSLPMRLAYGGSGLMARQILQGAPAELFLSANADWMDVLEREERLMPGTRRNLLCNDLVLIGPAGAVELAQIPSEGRIATGLVNAVPAGQYAKQALSSLGLWENVQSRLVETDNVRAALALVSRKEMPFGIVYRTDALADPGVSVIYEFTNDDTGPITYPIALIEGASEAAARILDALQMPSASNTFKKHGCGVI